MAFSDDLIRALVKTGRYTDPKAEAHLADMLIKRRDRIGFCIPAVGQSSGEPSLSIETGRLTFENAAVNAGVSKPPAGGYLIRWFSFDNNTGSASPIGSPAAVTGTEARAPGTLARR